MLRAVGAGDIVAAMRALLETPALGAGLRAMSLARAAEFSWERTARATYEVYHEARRRHGAD